MRRPSIGDMVHYTSYGTPHGEYTSQCRAAVVAGIPDINDTGIIELCVLNPTGIFFHQSTHHDVSLNKEYRGGTWHWTCT
jgi:hypothetical protein